MDRGKRFTKLIMSEEELRHLVGYPSELVKNKVITYLDEHCREFISLSPFLMIGTANSSGFCDVSPRGDGPGFTLVLDEKHLLIPERPGNRRMDTITNILSNPMVGLNFFIPGLGETLRVNGIASLVLEDDLLEKMAVNGKKPLLGIGIQVEECFMHCAKAFIRSGLWNPESWLNKADLPSAAKMLSDHVKISKYSTKDIEDLLEKDYEEELY